MLHHTFCHIPGIGPKFERGLWRDGISSWGELESSGAPRLTPVRRARLMAGTAESRERLAARDARYFGARLPPDQQWRLFGEFRGRYACLDIETTGTSVYSDHVTVMSLYDGTTIRHYVWEENLEQVEEDLQAYDLLITFNGKTFDLPFLRHHHGLVLDHAHIDLRYVLRSLGFRGGLKVCEQHFGLNRGELDGVDGYWAVLLWQDYERRRDPRALQTLLAYNMADTVNLARLMHAAWNLKVEETPFATELRLPLPETPELPFRPDPDVLARIRARLGDAFFAG